MPIGPAAAPSGAPNPRVPVRSRPLPPAPPPRDPAVDAATQERANQARALALAEIRRRLFGRSATYDLLLPFDEVVAALGRRGERDLGEQVIDVESVVGVVDRRTGFDRLFRRPAGSPAAAAPSPVGAAGPVPPTTVPPTAAPPSAVEAYRVGVAHFVAAGHDQVAAARGRGEATLAAHVIEVLTVVGAARPLGLADLPLKGHERVFAERVPLPQRMLARIQLRQPDDYADLAERVEAWAFRYQQLHGTPLSRPEIARTWFTDEYEPVVALLADAGLLAGRPETEAYLRLAAGRYQLLRTPVWDDTALAALRGSATEPVHPEQ